MVLEADISVKQLRHINKHLRAKNGNPGRTSCCQGRNGEHLVVKVQVYINNKGTSSFIFNSFHKFFLIFRFHLEPVLNAMVC